MEVPPDPRPPDPLGELNPLVRRVQLGFFSASAGVAIVGLILHREAFWLAGCNLLMIQGMVVLNDRFLRPYGLRPHGGHRLISILKAAAIVVPICLAIQIVFLHSFPNWFPASCPLPPRH